MGVLPPHGPDADEVENTIEGIYMDHYADHTLKGVLRAVLKAHGSYAA
jgi:hypothetical protein